MNTRPHELPSLSSTMLGRVQQMQPDAWTQLVEVFGPIVYRWSRQAGLSTHDATDVVQDVFVSVARGIRDFHRSQENQSFRNWLASITRNRVRDHWRRAAKHPDATGGTDALLNLQQMVDPVDRSPEDSISLANLEGEITRRVMDIVRSEFEERSWLAFRKTVVDGQRASDVAAEMGMTVAAVYQARSRIFRRIRQQLSDLPK